MLQIKNHKHPTDMRRNLSGVALPYRIGLTLSLSLILRLATAQTPNYPSLFLANQTSTLGTVQTPLSIGNMYNATTTPSFQFNTYDDGTSHLDLHSPRWGSSILFTRMDPSNNSYGLAWLYGTSGNGATFSLYNASNQVTLSLNGQGNTYINSGNVGIGTVTPGNLLEIATTSQLDGLKVSYKSTGLVRLHANSLTAGAYNNVVQSGDAGILFGTNGTAPNFGFVIAPWSPVTGGIRVTASGNVLIGKGTQTNSAYVLDINGTERANTVVVNTTGADFVFDSDYRLPSVQKVEQYIKAHRHLPDIQPAQQMQQEGIDLGNNQTRLLQKIEELTLYLIDQEKELSELKKQNQCLEQHLGDVEAHERQLEERNHMLENLEQRIRRLERSSGAKSK
jgi:hypothetical protein